MIPRCWLTECGYTVAEFRIGDGEVVTLAVTRPGESAPWAYCDTRDQVVVMINADKAAELVAGGGA